MDDDEIVKRRRKNLERWFQDKTRPDKEKSYISQLLTGTASFGEKAARRLERDYGMGHKYLDQPLPEPLLPASTLPAIEVPQFNASGSMGEGIPVPDNDVIVDAFKLSKTWIDQHLRPLSSHSNLACITGKGDSMLPTFADGDILLVDTGVHSPDVDAVYVLSAHARLYVKRVRQRIDGSFEISSDNPT